MGFNQGLCYFIWMLKEIIVWLKWGGREDKWVGYKGKRVKLSGHNGTESLHGLVIMETDWFRWDREGQWTGSTDRDWTDWSGWNWLFIVGQVAQIRLQDLNGLVIVGNSSDVFVHQYETHQVILRFGWSTRTFTWEPLCCGSKQERSCMKRVADAAAAPPDPAGHLSGSTGWIIEEHMAGIHYCCDVLMFITQIKTDTVFSFFLTLANARPAAKLGVLTGICNCVMVKNTHMWHGRIKVLNGLCSLKNNIQITLFKNKRKATWILAPVCANSPPSHRVAMGIRHHPSSFLPQGELKVLDSNVTDWVDSLDFPK